MEMHYFEHHQDIQMKKTDTVRTEYKHFHCLDIEQAIKQLMYCTY